ncbi:hypothetical protein FHG87_011874 [Trinorchestia longiramus]|nr:hypothetical protein FHG87_011874 [Trinorchestia longiramus]
MPFSPESDEGERVSQRHSSSASEAVTPSSASNGDNSDLPTASTRSSALDKTTSRRGFEVASVARSQDLGNVSTTGSPQNVVSVHGREGIATQNIRQIGDRKSDEEKTNNNLESVSGSQKHRNSKERGKEKTRADSTDSKYQSRKNQNSSEQLPFNPLTGLVGTTAVFTPPPINSSDPSAMILWRAQRGRAGHGDPRMVQSLDQELLEAADVTGRLRADQLRADQLQGLTQRLSRELESKSSLVEDTHAPVAAEPVLLKKQLHQSAPPAFRISETNRDIHDESGVVNILKLDDDDQVTETTIQVQDDYPLSQPEHPTDEETAPLRGGEKLKQKEEVIYGNDEESIKAFEAADLERHQSTVEFQKQLQVQQEKMNAMKDHKASASIALPDALIIKGQQKQKPDLDANSTSFLPPINDKKGTTRSFAQHWPASNAPVPQRAPPVVLPAIGTSKVKENQPKTGGDVSMKKKSSAYEDFLNRKQELLQKKNKSEQNAGDSFSQNYGSSEASSSTLTAIVNHRENKRNSEPFNSFNVEGLNKRQPDLNASRSSSAGSRKNSPSHTMKGIESPIRRGIQTRRVSSPSLKPSNSATSNHLASKTPNPDSTSSPTLRSPSQQRSISRSRSRSSSKHIEPASLANAASPGISRSHFATARLVGVVGGAKFSGLGQKEKPQTSDKKQISAPNSQQENQKENHNSVSHSSNAISTVLATPSTERDLDHSKTSESLDDSKQKILSPKPSEASSSHQLGPQEVAEDLHAGNRSAGPNRSRGKARNRNKRGSRAKNKKLRENGSPG